MAVEKRAGREAVPKLTPQEDGLLHVDVLERSHQESRLTRTRCCLQGIQGGLETQLLETNINTASQTVGQSLIVEQNGLSSLFLL